MARPKVVGKMVKTDNDRFMFILAPGIQLRANIVSTVAKVLIFCGLAHSSAVYFFLNQISRPDTGKCRERDGEVYR